MAEQRPPGGAGNRRDAEIADANWLFRDDPAGKSAQPAARPTPPASSDEVFDLVESPDLEPGPAPGPRPMPEPAPMPEAPPARRRETAARRAGEPSRRELEDLVEEVWSRQAEWGPTLLILAAWILAVVILVYVLCGYESYAMGFLILLAGGAGAVVLSYPILITLERPVRVTPEQAVRDFYGALSHHFPHYRRMWLLLSTAGRATASYGSFEGFKAYWADRLRTLKGRQAGPMTPLVFEVANYRGDKSAGLSRVDARFTLKISIRGRRQAGPIASIPAAVALVRGPDKMWYLEDGTLPHPAREQDSA